ncbi:MAG: type IX secretion system sortase PorU [Bacteroidales bacterium]|nr:type IX secretion system sortase PorU [Bacteroidales bacterium]
MKNSYLHIIITIALGLLLHLPSQAQDGGFFNGNLEWQPPKELIAGEPLLYFERAVNHADFGLLPVFYHRFRQPGQGQLLEISFVEGQWEYQLSEELKSIEEVVMIGEEPLIIVVPETVQKRRYYAIYLLPFRKAGENGDFERLTSFSLSYSWNEEAQAELFSQGAGRSYASHSVLRTGEWSRLSVTQTGIYRLDYQDLIVMGIDPGSIDPRQIRIYGNGAGMLEETNAQPRSDDLVENTIFIYGEEDGIFDETDYILFYGEGPVAIKYNNFFQKFEHEVHFYSDETFYFLTVDQGGGKRIQPGELIFEDPTHEVYHSEDLIYHERDDINLIKSGKIWYGEVFNDQLRYNFSYDLPFAEPEEAIYIKVSLAGRATTATTFNFYANDEFISKIDVPSVTLGSNTYARPLLSNFLTVYPDGNTLEVGIEFEKKGDNDRGWLNYFNLNYLRKLVFDEGHLLFRDTRVAGPGHIARYHLQTQVQYPVVWDVTHRGEIMAQTLQPADYGYSFKARADEIRSYIIFDGTAFLQARFVEKVENQDLHGLPQVDYLIISHPLFLEQANRLADFHRQFSGMTVAVVTPQQVYNEFSSGAQDVTAIRDFAKMFYDRDDEGSGLRYLLLFGDASYDYKGRIQPDHNFVPTYQSRESLNYAGSFVTDDYFGCLDDDEGSNGSGTVDIGIGRLPAHTVEQAEAMVDKILHYASNSLNNFSPWRNEIFLVGDDEDNNIHLNQAEGLAEITQNLGPVYNIKKIYLDAFAQLQTPAGARYPDAYEAITKAVDEGCLIINYTGHGGEIGWAGERVLDIPAIQAFRNLDNLPAFVTATCEFSRYDDPGLTSAGELVLLNPYGGGIALFTTTRLAYSQSNYALNKRFYEAAFILDSISGKYPRMGDLIRLSKTPSNQNIKNFVLLGDPALMLAYPQMKVRTLSVINENAARPADTIHAMSVVTITGQVEDLIGNKLHGFNGLLYPTVLDKPVLYKTRGNDLTSKVQNFYMQDRVLYKGLITVTNGEFSFTFVVPKDISYQMGEGKISYYAVDTNTFLDAHGHDMIWIGGSDSLGIADTKGPDIKLYLNSLSFISGDITTPEPLLIAWLFDESGINTVGNGIGHDIVAVIDNNYQMPIVLNNYYRPLENSYQQGDIQYRLGPFENGTHTLTLKAWDVLNNSSEATISFRVNTGARLMISNVYSYPNPTRVGTWFVFDHNKPGASYDVTIQIFNLMGQQVHNLTYSFSSEGISSDPYYWNGKDSSGNELSSGLYVYHLLVRSDDGYMAEASRKIILAR